MRVQDVTPNMRVRLTPDAAIEYGVSQGLGVVASVDPGTFWVNLVMALHGKRRYRAHELEPAPNDTQLKPYVTNIKRAIESDLDDLADAIRNNNFAKVPVVLERIREHAALSPAALKLFRPTE